MSATLVVLALVVAIALRPWKEHVARNPPWVWFALCSFIPCLWYIDRLSPGLGVGAISGAVLLALIGGWALSVLALIVTAFALVAADLVEATDALERLVWLGILPATLSLALGWFCARLLPSHPFVFILGRGFFCTFLACGLAGLIGLGITGVPANQTTTDVAIARLLLAGSEAFWTGALVAMFVTCRPEWLTAYGRAR